jgi:hypothetical protein
MVATPLPPSELPAHLHLRCDHPRSPTIPFFCRVVEGGTGSIRTVSEIVLSVLPRASTE